MLKKEIYGKSKLTLVCVSQWLADRVEQSILRGHDLHVIPNGIDTDLFAPMDKVEARRMLGLPLGDFLCGFSADGGFHNPWKGGDLAIELAGCLKAVGCSLVCIGGEKKEPNGNILALGYLDDPEMMVAAYNAMDLWIHPTRAESFGLVVAEAMACEIPVIASNVCAVPELVVDGVTGVLINDREAESFLDAIKCLLQDPEKRHQMGIAARNRISSDFSEGKMIASYMMLYDELMEK